MINQLVYFAQDVCQGLCEGDATGLPKVTAGDTEVKIILQLAFGVIGTIALIMLIIAGFNLSTSGGGNPEAAAKARKTIIYTVIGLFVAISGELIVSFALDRL